MTVQPTIVEELTKTVQRQYGHFYRVMGAAQQGRATNGLALMVQHRRVRTVQQVPAGR
jgi:hypothetical protein